MRKLDSHPDVLEWSSEEFWIPYISPIDDKQHRYYPDVLVKLKNRDGEIKTMLYEVKPAKKAPITDEKGRFLNPPKRGHRQRNTTYLKESMEYARNAAKFDAAEKFCAKMGWEWKVLTEDELGIKQKK